ncbi:lipoprotein [Noviherbaspirillum sp. 17J57-3]|uniref:Lipoprotein n=2 Tax=Noviherbaspirillum galbum TaxID=2709383 RepID=A0A6B3SL20_9BURK|nr:lipoprotein [Noviherbaspirillum galbum]
MPAFHLPSLRPALVAIALAFSGAALLAGCGQKGPLTLPARPVPQNPPVPAGSASPAAPSAPAAPASMPAQDNKPVSQ